MKLGAVLIAAGKKRQSLAALRRDYRCPKNDCNPSENRCDTDHSGYGTVRQENGKAACPVWRILSTESTAGKPGYIHFLRHSFPGRNISKEGHDSKRTLQQCSEIILEIIIILGIIVVRK